MRIAVIFILFVFAGFSPAACRATFDNDNPISSSETVIDASHDTEIGETHQEGEIIYFTAEILPVAEDNFKNPHDRRAVVTAKGSTDYPVGREVVITLSDYALEFLNDNADEDNSTHNLTCRIQPKNNWIVDCDIVDMFN